MKTIGKYNLYEAQYEDTKSSRWSVEYYSESYGVMRYSVFNEEKYAIEYFLEKKEEGHKKLKMIKTEMTTITTEYTI